jgi:hypothetical protein
MFEEAFHQPLYGWQFALFCIIVFGGALCVYFIPTFIAIWRKLYWPWIFAFNAMFGYTIIGWLIAFWWALMAVPPEVELRMEHDLIRGAVADGMEDAMYPGMRRVASSPPGPMVRRRPPAGNRFNRREPPPLRGGSA